MDSKNILLVATTSSMIELFNSRNIRILQKLGFNVFVAANFKKPGSISVDDSQKFISELENIGVKWYQVDFKRGVGNPFSNHQAYISLLKIVKDNNISLIHTQAPLSSIIARRVAKKLHVQCIYTAHGFQFFPKGPLKDWILFFPVEWYYAHWTDDLILINRDDYHVSKYLPIRRKNVHYIPSVGADIKKSSEISSSKKKDIRLKVREHIGIKNDDFMVLSVGELTNRKNHSTVLKAIAKLNNPKIQYVIAGVGANKDALIKEAKELGMSKQLHLLGFQKSVSNLYLAADLNAFVSKREGLGMGGLDGVALGLYIIANGRTGSKDFIPNERMGILIKDPNDVNEISNAINKVMEENIKADPDYDFLMKFDKKNVDRIMENIYKKYAN